MTPDTPPIVAHSLQACRSCGGGAPVDVHFCPQCTKILSLGRHGDYFSYLGVPRKLAIDAGLLEDRFRALSRQFHPDYYYNATPAERRASLERYHWVANFTNGRDTRKYWDDLALPLQSVLGELGLLKQ